MGRGLCDDFDRDRLYDLGRGAFAIFEYLGIDDRARIPSLVLLATLIVINVVWRALDARAGRVELIVRAKSVGGSGSKGGDQGRL